MRKLAYLTVIGILFGFLLQHPFVKRVMTYPRDHEITQVEWYGPTEKISGSFRSEFQNLETDQVSRMKSTLSHLQNYSMDRNTTGLLVLHQGKIALEKYASGFNVDSVTNSMSMAKTILALGVGIAIDEGKIHSEKDFVAQYIPEWKNDSRNLITIEHLLQMTSGLNFDDNPNNLFSDLVVMHAGSQIQSLILNIKPKQAPGLEYEYLNVNSQILSLILERVSGLRYADYISEKIWKPLGLKDAHLWLDRAGGSTKAYCCLFTTLRDWGRVGQFFLEHFKNVDSLSSPRIVSHAWLKKMLTPSPLKKTYGYHITLGEGAFYLDGRGKQKVYVIPSQDLVVVRVGESPKDWDDSVFTQTRLYENVQLTQSLDSTASKAN